MSDVLGWDASGNGNDWTVNNLSITDQMLDSPTNNFATWNPLDTLTSTDSEGNLRTSVTTSNASATTIGMPSGKWYAEVYCVSGEHTRVGLVSEAGVGAGFGNATGTWSKINNVSRTYAEGTLTNYGAEWDLGQIAMVAFDADTGKLWFGVDGTWDAYGNPGTGANPSLSGITGDNFFFAVSSGTGTIVYVLNTGQDSSFASNKTAQGNTDSNDIGDFFYTPPTGFLALCTKNLPDVATGLWSGGNNQAFNTVTYTGNGTADNSISVGFKPDFIWGKTRTSGSHLLYDSIRGGTQYLVTNSTAIEGGAANTGITSFDDDGFTLPAASGYLNNSVAYVAWNWKAGGTPTVDNSASAGSTPTAGSVKIDGVNLGSALAGSIAATRLSANTKAGFSIVQFAGGAGTIAHGLDYAPEMIIEKKKDATGDWFIQYTVVDGTSDYMRFTTAAGTASSSSLPTTTVFDSNIGGNNVIAYCFHSVEGYSKVGSYTGNGSDDGTFVHTGFKPAYVMMKKAVGGTSHWNIRDAERDPDNVTTEYLLASDSGAEGTTSGNLIDFTSNGFKIRGTSSASNTTGHTYIFIAFAEVPFKYSTAR